MTKEESIRDRNISDEDKFTFLKQLIQTLEETEIKMEKAYKNKDYENFSNIKKFMIEIQEKIKGLIT